MKNCKKGFTLIELLLSLALVGIVLQVVFSVFFVSNASYNISSSKGFSQQDVRMAGDFVTSELRYVTEMSSTDEYAGEYYSMKIVNTSGKLVLTKTFHKYNGDGTEVNKADVTDQIIISELAGNWNSFTITNTTQGEIDVFISQEEITGNQKSGYELPLKILPINKRGLLSNINGLDLMAGGVLYYRNNLVSNLVSGIDMIDTTPIGGGTGQRTIKFYKSEDLSQLHSTIIGTAGEEKDMPNEPAKGGYNFGGWNTKADGTGQSYSGDKIKIPSEDLILHAIWNNTGLAQVLIGNIVSIDENANLHDVTKDGIVYYKIKKANQGGSKVTIKLVNYTTNHKDMVTFKVSGAVDATRKDDTITFTAKPAGNGSGETLNIIVEITTSGYSGKLEKRFYFISD